MKIHEYQGKAILKKYGVTVPRGTMATSPEEAEAAARELFSAGAQHITTDRVDLSVAVDEANHPLALLERLDQAVEQDPVEAAIAESEGYQGRSPWLVSSPPVLPTPEHETRAGWW